MINDVLNQTNRYKWPRRLGQRFVKRRSRALHISHRQTALFNRIALALTDETPLDDVLGQVLNAIAVQLQSTWVTLFFYDPRQDTLVVRLAYRNGQINSAAEATPILAQPFPARDIPLWQEMRRTRRPIVVADVANDPRLKYRETLLADEIGSLLLVPLLLDAQVIGWFSLNFPHWQGHRLEEELQLAPALAQQAAVAVQLTRLAERSRQMAVLEERNRFAHEIHDTLAQGLTGIVIQLEAAEEVLPEESSLAQQHLDRARRLARASLAEARRSVQALRPQALEQGNLGQALAHLVDLMAGATSIQAKFRQQGQPRPLTPKVEDNLLLIGQEALTNALKHAQASQIWVELFFGPEQVLLSVEDNGLGFDLTTLPDGGLGLTSLRQRTDQIRGELSIQSQPGKGTKITCQVKM